MHGVEASALEAGGTQEVWTVPEPETSCDFCFDDDFHVFNYSFGKPFLILMALLI